MIHDQEQRRLNRVRNKLKNNMGVPRLSVLRTNRHFWAQIIDDKHGRTLLAGSTKALKNPKGTKTEIASQLGEIMAKEAIEKKITKVRFDRGIFKYHGRVKAFAEAARKGGLNF